MEFKEFHAAFRYLARKFVQVETEWNLKVREVLEIVGNKVVQVENIKLTDAQSIEIVISFR